MLFPKYKNTSSDRTAVLCSNSVIRMHLQVPVSIAEKGSYMKHEMYHAIVN